MFDQAEDNINKKKSEILQLEKILKKNDKVCRVLVLKSKKLRRQTTLKLQSRTPEL